MVRRVSVPGADELFRPTHGGPDDESVLEATSRAVAERQPSGRVRHDEKMTVYLTSAEMTEIETARLTLRSAHGLAVDRGRLVRAALALALADLDERGENSELITRLDGR